MFKEKFYLLSPANLPINFRFAKKKGVVYCFCNIKNLIFSNQLFAHTSIWHVGLANSFIISFFQPKHNKWIAHRQLTSSRWAFYLLPEDDTHITYRSGVASLWPMRHAAYHILCPTL